MSQSKYIFIVSMNVKSEFENLFMKLFSNPPNFISFAAPKASLTVVKRNWLFIRRLFPDIFRLTTLLFSGVFPGDN